jgi:ribonuclease BN (tRNA processing enzyme)
MLERDGLKISAARVRHPPITHAYRFDAPDRSMVLAGDATYWLELIALAKEADVAVHEFMHLGGLNRLLARAANAPSLCKHPIDSRIDRAVRPGSG